MIPASADLMRDVLFLPEAASRQARDIDALHFWVISATMLGALAVGLTALVFLVKYRRMGDRPRPTRFIALPVKYELAMAGLLLGLFLAWWFVGYRQMIALQRAPEGALEIYVTGKQWMWKFASADGPDTVGVLVVPAARPVRLLITARDVVHSFFVPALRVKQDAIPGRYTSLSFTIDRPGSFPVYCAEYCGLSHSRMWATLVALPPEEYQRWLEGAVPPAVGEAGGNADIAGGRLGEREAISIAQRGEQQAARYGCLACHTVDGQPHIGPTWRGLFGSERVLVTGQRLVADAAYLTQSMMRPMEDLVAGYPPVMPTYQGQMEPADVAAIVEYIKSLRHDAGRAP